MIVSPRLAALAWFLAPLAVACGSTDASGTGSPSSSGSPSGSPTVNPPSPGFDGGGGGGGEDAGSVGDASAPPSNDAGGGGGGGGNGGAIPTPTGTCPDFKQGQVTFSPSGIPPRAVQLYMSDAAATKHGPLIFYWHGTGSSPQEATYSLGAQINAITAAGGIVAAPTADPNAGQFPWYLVSGTKEDDLKVADEVLGCAMQKVGIDARRIHSMGMSAGGLHTTAMAFKRSSYLASVVIFSGGIPAGTNPPYQDPSNKWPAMIFYGGSSDNVFGFDFQAASQALDKKLRADGHFDVMCNHGRGHAIPTDAAASVWQFFQDHPFGTNPSPYAGGLPKGFPTYCTL